MRTTSRRRCRPARAAATDQAALRYVSVEGRPRARGRPCCCFFCCFCLYFYCCYFFFVPRFSRTRTEIWIGVPSKPNSSRSRRSTKRR